MLRFLNLFGLLMAAAFLVMLTVIISCFVLQLLGVV